MPDSSSLVARGEHPAPGHHLTELAQLDQADGGLDVGHPEIEADLGVMLDNRLLGCGAGRPR